MAIAEDFDVSVETLRKPRVRGVTQSVKRLSKRALEQGRSRANELLDGIEETRPTVRSQCLPGGRNAERPCPWVSCAHHLYIDVSPRSGAIKVNFPDLEVWEMPETCALDVADRMGLTLDEVATLMNLTRERIRQLETRSVAKLRELDAIAALAGDIDDEADAGHRKHRSAETQDNATLAHDLDTTAVGNRDLAVAPYITEAIEGAL